MEGASRSPEGGQYASSDHPMGTDQVPARQRRPQTTPPRSRNIRGVPPGPVHRGTSLMPAATHQRTEGAPQGTLSPRSVVGTHDTKSTQARRTHGNQHYAAKTYGGGLLSQNAYGSNRPHRHLRYLPEESRETARPETHPMFSHNGVSLPAAAHRHSGAPEP